MYQRITVTDAARHFSEFLNRVAFGGERFVLVRGKKPVAELRPVDRGRTTDDLPSLLSSLPALAQGDDGFERDIAEARASLSTREFARVPGLVVENWAE